MASLNRGVLDWRSFRSVALWISLALGARALPENPSVTHGQVQISNPAAGILHLLQSTPQAIVNWNSFNIRPDEVVRFLQPDAWSVILNRVVGIDPSMLQGTLQANGRVFLVNPNGILFGPNAHIDVGSFMATTLALSDRDFLEGNYSLAQSPDHPLTAIVNQGHLEVAEGGFLVLAAPLIHNQGLVVARGGEVRLGASTHTTFSVDGSGRVQFAVPDGFRPDFSAQGNGGTVLMAPGQMTDLLSQVVQHPGVLEAGQLQGPAVVGGEGLLVQSGTIEVGSGMAELNSSGATVTTGGSRILANADQGRAGTALVLSAGTTLHAGVVEARGLGAAEGGFIEVSGREVGLHGPVRVDAQSGRHGSFLLDPGNLTLVDSAPGSLNTSLPTITNSTGGSGSHTVSTAAIGSFGNVVLEATNDVNYVATTGFSATTTDLHISAGNNLNFSGTNLDISVGSLNITAGGQASFTSTQDMNLILGGGGTGNLTVQAGSIAINAGDNLFINSSNDLRLTATAGNVRIDYDADSTMIAGNITLEASNGSIILDSTLDQPFTFNSVGTTRLLAGQDITIHLGSSQTGQQTQDLNLLTTDAVFDANRDLSIRVNDITGFANVDFQAGRNLTLRNDNGGSNFTLNANNVTMSAGNDLQITAVKDIALSSLSDMRLTAGNNLIATADDIFSSNALQSTEMRATSGNLTIQNHQNGAHSGINSPLGNIQLSAGNQLTIATNGTSDFRIDSQNTVELTAQDIVLDLGRGAGSGQAGFLAVTPDFVLDATQTVTVNASFFNNGNLGNTVIRGQDIRFANGDSAADLTLSHDTLAINATNDLIFDVAGELLVNTVSDLQVQVGDQFTSTSTGNQSWTVAGEGNLSAGNISINSDQQFALTAMGDVLMASSGDLNISSRFQGAVSSANTVIEAPSGSITFNTRNDEPFILGTPVLGSTASVAAGIDLTVSLGSSQSGQQSQDLLLESDTTLTAGRDVLLSLNDVDGRSGGGFSIQAGRDVILQSDNGGRNATLLSSGPLDIQAGNNITLNANQSTLSMLDVRATQVQMTAGNNILLNANSGVNVEGPGGLNLTASNGNLTVQSGATSGASQLVTDVSSDLTLRAGNNLLIATNNTEDFRIQGDASLSAGGNLTINLGRGAGSGAVDLVAGGPALVLSASGDVSVNTTRVLDEFFGLNLTMSGQNLRLGSSNANTGGLNISVDQIDLQAVSDIVFSVTGPLPLQSQQSINLAAGGNISVTSSGAQS